MTYVDKFNQLFTTLSYNKDLGLVSLNLLTVSKLVKLAETKYQRFHGCRERDWRWHL
jgi:hypothetical protein